MEMVNSKTAFPKYPAYKDSGVEWLGEVPSNWEVLPLFALTKLKSISNCPELELLSVYLDLGVIRFSDIDAKRTNATSLDLSKYQKVEPGDFVLNNQQAWRGSVGVSNYEGIISPAYIILALSEKLNPSFANYYFRNGAMVSQYLISSKGVGTIQRNLYWPQLRRTYVGIPPKEEQTAIANFLDEKTNKIDQAIAQKEKMIALLKERKQIIIQNAVTKGLDPNVKLKDSGVEWIGEIPEGWEVKRLKFIGNAIIGLTYSPNDVCNEAEGTLVLRSSNLFEGKFKYGEKENVYVKTRISNKLMIKENDILICSRNGSRDLIGKCALASNNDVGVSFGAFTTVFRSNINPYLFNILNSEIFKYLSGMFLTSTINQLTIGNLNSIEVPIPPENERGVIDNYIKELSLKIDNSIIVNQSQIKKLKEYKATLIDSAVTGKIMVSG
jgi:type I restriction enzyme S subunit